MVVTAMRMSTNRHSAMLLAIAARRLLAFWLQKGRKVPTAQKGGNTKPSANRTQPAVHMKGTWTGTSCRTTVPVAGRGGGGL